MFDVQAFSFSMQRVSLDGLEQVLISSCVAFFVSNFKWWVGGLAFLFWDSHPTFCHPETKTQFPPVVSLPDSSSTIMQGPGCMGKGLRIIHIFFVVGAHCPSTCNPPSQGVARQPRESQQSNGAGPKAQPKHHANLQKIKS